MNNNKYDKIEMKKIIHILSMIPILFWGVSCHFLVSTRCPECKECDLTLKYEWKVPSKGFDIINMDNDRLIGSRYDKHYIFDKMTGLVTDTIFDFVPKKTRNIKNKYLWLVGETKNKKGIYFTTSISQFTVAEDYKGYKIILQEWYKDIRGQINNRLNSVLVFEDNKQIREICLPRMIANHPAQLADYQKQKKRNISTSNKQVTK